MRRAMIGPGSMGGGMAQSPTHAGLDVAGHDAGPVARTRLGDAGCVVANADQAGAVLFGAGRCVDATQPGSMVVSSATMAPGRARDRRAGWRRPDGTNSAATSDAGLRERSRGVPDAAGGDAGPHTRRWLDVRDPHPARAGRRPRSAVDSLTKDLGVALDTARTERLPLPLADAAHRLDPMTAAPGPGGDGDASVACLSARIAGPPLPQPAKEH